MYTLADCVTVMPKSIIAESIFGRAEGGEHSSQAIQQNSKQNTFDCANPCTIIILNQFKIWQTRMVTVNVDLYLVSISWE